MRLGLVEQERVEVATASEQRLRRHRGQQVGEVGELARLPTARHANALMNEVPLVSREALLCLEREGRDPELSEHAGGVARLAAEGNLPSPVSVAADV